MRSESEEQQIRFRQRGFLLGFAVGIMTGALVLNIVWRVRRKNGSLVVRQRRIRKLYVNSGR
jgi:hypothetical protein